MDKGQKIERSQVIYNIKTAFFIIFCVAFIILLIIRILDPTISNLDIFIIVLLIAFLILAMVFTILSYKNEKIYIYDDYLEYYDIFNKCEQIYYRDIKSWRVVNRGYYRGGKYKVLVIKTNDEKKIEIIDNDYKLSPLYKKINQFKGKNK